MQKAEEKEILEYRVHKDEDCILVRWSDGVESWERISSLSQKSLVLEFFQHCFDILTEKQREEETKRQKEMEKALFEEIINKNVANTQEPKPADNKNEIIAKIRMRDALGPSQELFPGLKKYPKAPPLLKKAVVEDNKPALTVPARKKVEDPQLSGQEKSVSDLAKRHTSQIQREKDLGQFSVQRLSQQPNRARIAYRGSTVCSIIFFEAPGKSAVTVALENCFFFPFDTVAPLVQYFSTFQPESIQVFGAELEMTMGSFSDNSVDLDWVLGKSTSMLAFENEGSDYVLYFPKEDDRILPFSTSGYRSILFKLPKTYEIEACKDVIRAHEEIMTWDDGTYRSSVLNESSLMLGKLKMPPERKVFFIGDGFALSSHAFNLLKHSVDLADDLTVGADLVVQSTLYDYLHQIPGIEKMNEQGRKVYGLKPFALSEIQHKNCLFFINDKFVLRCDMNMLYGFISKVITDNSNTLVLNDMAYSVLVKRAGMIPSRESSSAWYKLLEKIKKFVYPGSSRRVMEDVRQKFGLVFRNFIEMEEGKRGCTLKEAFQMV